MTTRSKKAEVLRELGGDLDKIDQELKIVRRGAQVLSQLVSLEVPVMHLGLTQTGQPRHPLRLLKTLEAIPLAA